MYIKQIINTTTSLSEYKVVWVVGRKARYSEKEYSRPREQQVQILQGGDELHVSCWSRVCKRESNRR